MAKFSITLKDPDYSIVPIVLTPSQIAVKDDFIRWDEYVTIEFDTATKTARVVPVKEKS